VSPAKYDADHVLDGLRVDPGDRAKLSARNPANRCGLKARSDGAALVATDLALLSDLHDRLWAESARSLLLVLQAFDAGGKDGTIRHVFSGVNPQGCRIVSFKAPTPAERAHDFLWRIHQAAPAAGEFGIFNRSHYEDVVAARAIGVIDDRERKRRYKRINAFEEHLTESGTTVVKCFLHISADEQRERLQARLDDPRKRWKFSPSDLEVRKDWDRYQELYDDAISATSTKHAPWCVIPANHKWVRDAVISRLLVDTLELLDPKYPKPVIPPDVSVV
jgi:PPK2 family polyphosphate:nucleotide phosphotransferase